MKITEENENKDKFKFQSNCAGSKHCLDLDFGCVEETFSTHEPDFYKKIFQRRDERQDKNTFTFL